MEEGHLYLEHLVLLMSVVGEGWKSRFPFEYFGRLRFLQLDIFGDWLDVTPARQLVSYR
jgi:hypothetical protein